MVCQLKFSNTLPMCWSHGYFRSLRLFGISKLFLKTCAVFLPFFFKMGKKRCCKNYRGTNLIDVAAKFFAYSLLRRFHSESDRRTRPNQRRSRNCIDQIFTLRRTDQEWTVVYFDDIAIRFNFVNRNALWGVMYADGIPSELLNVLKAYYRFTRTKIRTCSQESYFFDIRSVVRQGCVLVSDAI